MTRRKSYLTTIAGEESISFLMLGRGGGSKTLASIPLETFIDAGPEAGDLPAEVLQSVNQLLVVPDYWVGNHFQEFQSRKKSVITTFIERKLQQDQPSLSDVSNFYNYAIVQREGQGQHLYTFYLHEIIAYQVYQQLKQLGLGPVRITTPALMWQASLTDIADGSSDQGVGFIHLVEADCFLYFYFMGQFLFSRHIQLQESDGDATDTYNLLNYEINQSFYLYSQKTKRSVEALYMLAADPSAADRLSELLGREVLGLPHPPLENVTLADASVLPSCRGFSAKDLQKPGDHYIYYKPFKNELAWLPVQWAGIAVGMLLAVLLTVEAGYLHVLSMGGERQIHQLKSKSEEPPELVLEDISLSLDEITSDLARPSGSGTIMRTLLAMPEGVSVRKIALKVSESSRLTMDATITAEDPDAFKQTLTVFIDRLNRRFNLNPHALREKDVRIQLNRNQEDEKKPIYLINFGFEIP